MTGFYDWGRVDQYRHDAGVALATPNAYQIAGYGVGLSLIQPGRHELRLMWAQKVGSNPGQLNGKDNDGTDSRSRVWIALSQYF